MIAYEQSQYFDLAYMIPIIPYASQDYVNDNTMQQWLDANFYLCGNYQTKFPIPRGLHRRQPGRFTTPSGEITAIVLDVPPTISWGSRGGRGFPGNPTQGFLPIHTRDTKDGEFTQLSEGCVEALDIIDLTHSEALKLWTIDGLPNELQSRRGSSKAAGTELIKQPLRTDSIGSFSFFGDNGKVRCDFSSNAPKEFAGILLESLYRGKGEAKAKVTTVTKKQVLDGRAIFLYKSKVLTLNQTQGIICYRNALSLGSFLTFASILKFKKSREFMNQLIRDLYDAPMKRLDPAGYTKLIETRTGPFTNYWEGATTIIDFTKVDDLPVLYDLVADTFKEETYLSNEALRTLDAKRFSVSSTVGKKKQATQAAIDSATSQRDSAKKAVLVTQQRLDVLTADIVTREEDIDLLTQRATLLQAENDTILTSRIPQAEKLKAEAEEIQLELNTVLKTFRKEHKQAIKAFSKEYNHFLQSNTTNYHDSMLRNDVIIKDIHFRNAKNGSIVSVKDDPTITSSADWSMYTLLMITTKPSCILVDQIEKGHDADQIAGGPYDIRLTLGTDGVPLMALRLTGHNSIFGKIKFGNEWRAKPHPHTDVTIVRPDMKSLTNFIEQWANCCLGSTEGTIQKGMQEANPKIIIAAVLSWLNSANSEDQWGKHWDWFPAVTDVNMNGRDAVVPAKDTPAPVYKLDPKIQQALSSLQNKIAPAPSAAIPVPF